VKRQLVAGGVPDQKIEVVYDGVDLPPEPAKGSAILALSTDDPMKGSELVRAAAEAGGFEVQFSRNLVQDLQHSAVLLYITHSEGLGSAALLAMAAGVPVVASRVGGLPEIVQNGETGVLTDNEPAAIAAAVRSALANRESMAEKARALVAKRFTTGRMVERTVEVYQGLLG
jgi:glycosyltransferase involved in cell wall biosynthesis